MLKIKQEVTRNDGRLATVDNIKCPCILRSMDDNLTVLVFKRILGNREHFEGVILRDDDEKSAAGSYFCLTISMASGWFFSDEEFTISNGPIV